jgi:hypothetical protein
MKEVSTYQNKEVGRVKLASIAGNNLFSGATTVPERIASDLAF